MRLFSMFSKKRRAEEKQQQGRAEHAGESAFVVTILDFFEDGFAQKAEWSLEELFSYFDYRQRTTPTADEINRAVSVYKKASLKRDGNEVHFVKADRESEAADEVTAAEVERAGKRYGKELAKKVKELNRDA